MSIKPIDFQVMLPKTMEVSKIHQDEQHKGSLLQQQAATASKEKTDLNMTQVIHQESAQGARIREKQEKNGGSKKKEEKKKSKGNYSGNKETEKEQKTSYIDIRL